MVPLMSESRDRRLGVFEYVELKLHLKVCAWCAQYLKQIKLVRYALNLSRDQTAADPDISLSPEAHQRIAKILDGNEVSTPSR
jgi:hypothetical protein